MQLVVPTVWVLALFCGPDLVTRYHIGQEVAKPYCWPLLAPGNVPLTRSWPMEPNKSTDKNLFTIDHVHQKSAWFCHGDVIPEGMQLLEKIKGVEGVDFWSEAKGHGQIVCTRIDPPKGGILATHNEWRTASGQKVLDEERSLSLHQLGEARLLIFDIDLHASVVPITFGDTKEGALGIRINDVIRAATNKGTISNAEGKQGEKECWGEISAWCDYSGVIEGKLVGLAILADPRNSYPTCWHVRAYGLMAANPFGRAKSGFPAMKGKNDLVRLNKGDHLKLRYGLLLHTGDATTGAVGKHYKEFVLLLEKTRPTP